MPCPFHTRHDGLGRAHSRGYFLLGKPGFVPCLDESADELVDGAEPVILGAHVGILQQTLAEFRKSGHCSNSLARSTAPDRERQPRELDSSSRFLLHRQSNAPVEASNDSHEPVDRESAELSVANAGQIRRSRAGDDRAIAYCQLPLVQRLDDLGGETGFQLLVSASGSAKSA
jgi:hypothetical protein